MTRADIYRPTRLIRVWGEWSRKYWKNIPGPFYSTLDNMMEMLASYEDPVHIIRDDDCEFIWRQPTTKEEYDACMGAMDMDCCASYQVDGNQHWTPALVREWWARRDELIHSAENLVQFGPKRFWMGHDGSINRPQIQEYIQFLKHDAEEYLRSYIFLLETGNPAGMQDALPNL